MTTPIASSLDNISLARPGAGQAVTVPVPTAARLEFAFDQAEGNISRDGENLVLSFEDGAVLTLEGFYDAFSPDMTPPLIVVQGQELPGEEFLAALGDPDLMPLAGPAGMQVGGGSYADSLLAGVGGVTRLGKMLFDADAPDPTEEPEAVEGVSEVAATASGIAGLAAAPLPAGPGEGGGEAPAPPPVPPVVPPVAPPVEPPAPPPAPPQIDWAYKARAVLYTSDASGGSAVQFRMLDFSGDSVSILNDAALAKAALLGGLTQKNGYFSGFSYDPATGLVTAALNQQGLEALAVAGAGGENLYEYINFMVGGRSYTMQVVVNQSGVYDSKTEDAKNAPADGDLAWGEWHSETDYIGTGGRAGSDLGDEFRFAALEGKGGRWDAAYGNQPIGSETRSHDTLKTGAGDDFVEIIAGGDVGAALRDGTIDTRDQAGGNDGDNTIIIRGEGDGILYGDIAAGTGDDVITISGVNDGAAHGVRIVDEGGDNVITITGEKGGGYTYGGYVGGYDGKPTGVLNSDGDGIHTGEGNDVVTVSGGVAGMQYGRITDQGGTNVIKVIGDSDGDGRGTGMNVSEIVARGDNTITVEGGISGANVRGGTWNGGSYVREYSNIITAEGEDHIRVTAGGAGASGNVVINSGAGVKDTVTVSGGTYGVADNVSVTSAEGRVAVAATGDGSTKPWIAGAAQRFQNETTKITGREVEISSGYREGAQGEWNVRGDYAGNSYGLSAEGYGARLEARGTDSVDVRAYSAGGDAAGARAAESGATNSISGGAVNIAALSSGGDAYGLDAKNTTSGTTLNKIEAQDATITALGGYAAGMRADNGKAEYTTPVANHKAHNEVAATGGVTVSSSWHGMEASAINGEAKNSISAGEKVAVTAGEDVNGFAMKATSTGKYSTAKNSIEAGEIVLSADSPLGHGMDASQVKAGGAARNEALSEGDVEISAGLRAMYANGQDRNDGAQTGAVNVIEAGGNVVLSRASAGMVAEGAGKNSIDAQGDVSIDARQFGLLGSGSGALNEVRSGGEINVTAASSGQTLGLYAMSGGENRLDGGDVLVSASGGGHTYGIYAAGTASAQGQNTLTGDSVTVRVHSDASYPYAVYAGAGGKNTITAGKAIIESSSSDPAKYVTGVRADNGGMNTIQGNAGQSLALEITSAHSAMYAAGGGINSVIGHDEADVVEISGSVNALSGGANRIATAAGADSITVNGNARGLSASAASNELQSGGEITVKAVSAAELTAAVYSVNGGRTSLNAGTDITVKADATGSGNDVYGVFGTSVHAAAQGALRIDVDGAARAVGIRHNDVPSESSYAGKEIEIDAHSTDGFAAGFYATSGNALMNGDKVTIRAESEGGDGDWAEVLYSKSPTELVRAAGAILQAGSALEVNAGEIAIQGVNTDAGYVYGAYVERGAAMTLGNGDKGADVITVRGEAGDGVAHGLYTLGYGKTELDAKSVEISAESARGDAYGLTAQTEYKHTGTSDNVLNVAETATISAVSKEGSAYALRAEQGGKNLIISTSSEDDDIGISVTIRAEGGLNSLAIQGLGNGCVNLIQGDQKGADYISIIGGVYSSEGTTINTGGGDDTISLHGKMSSNDGKHYWNQDDGQGIRAGDGYDTLILKASTVDEFNDFYRQWLENNIDRMHRLGYSSDGIESMGVESVEVRLEMGSGGAGDLDALGWLNTIFPSSDYDVKYVVTAGDGVENALDLFLNSGYAQHPGAIFEDGDGAQYRAHSAGAGDDAFAAGTENGLFSWKAADMGGTDTITGFDMSKDKLCFSDLLGGESKLDEMLETAGVWDKDTGTFTAAGDGIDIEFRLDMDALQASLKVSYQDAQHATHTQNVQFENFSNFSFDPSDADAGSQQEQVTALLDEIIKVTG